jgi:UDP-N-acetylmuramate dehydrogenase
LEWAAGIPGTVAGCVVMNAGTKLGEMKDSIKAVRMVNRKGQIVNLEAAQVRFEYRRALLPHGIVVGVWLQLKPGIRSEIERVVKDYLHYRRDTQPLAMPSAGCVFKNPPNDSAGRLIEAVGLKGACVGDAEVSMKHANFMVNRGQAKAADVTALIGKVRSAIRRRMGMRLDLELKIVGET